MTVIRQSTVRTIFVGPVLDSDGAAKTDEVVANIRITKNGVGAIRDGSTTLTHNHTGKYELQMAAGDTNTVGVLEITLDSGTNDMPITRVNVVEESVFDAVYASGATIGTDTARLTAARAQAIDDWINGGRLDLLLDAIKVVTDAQAADGSGLTAINLPNQTMDIIGNITGSLSGSVGSVTGAVGSVVGHTAQTADHTAAIAAIPTTPMRGTDGANTTIPPSAGEIQAELEENGASLLDTIRDQITLIKAVTDVIPDSGALTDLIAAVAAIPTVMRGTDNASTHDAADVLTAIQAAGTHLTLVKAVTDLFQFTDTNHVKSDATRIAGIELDGTGVEGDEVGPA